MKKIVYIFFIILLTVCINAYAINWEVSFKNSLGGYSSDKFHAGVSADGIDGFYPPLPPAPYKFIRIETIQGTNLLKKDYRLDVSEPWEIRLIVYDSAYVGLSGTNNLTWDCSQVPNNINLTLIDYGTDASRTNIIDAINLKQESSYGFDVINNIWGPYRYLDLKAELLPSSINISLKQGWNLISIPLILENNSAEHVFSGIDYSNLFYYDSVWKNVTEINNTFGYWIKADDNAILTVEGLLPENTTINLGIGWNLVGYPYLEEQSISALFDDATVYSYNGTWSSYITGRAFNSLQNLKTGYGYWVKTE